MNTEQAQQAIMKIGMGNPGALRIALEIAQEFGTEALEMALASGVRKHFLWMLYKDYNGADYGTMLNAIAFQNIPPDVERVSDEYTADFAAKREAFAQVVRDALEKSLKESLGKE